MIEAFRNWWNQRVRLASGDVEFAVGCRDGNDSTWRSDLVVLKIIAEELESKHQIQKQSDGTLAATPEFLTELAAAYKQQGCPDCTPAMAKQIWVVVAMRFYRLDSDFQRQLEKVIW